MESTWFAMGRELSRQIGLRLFLALDEMMVELWQEAAESDLASVVDWSRLASSHGAEPLPSNYIRDMYPFSVSDMLYPPHL